MQSDKKSDYASHAQALFSASLKNPPQSFWRAVKIYEFVLEYLIYKKPQTRKINVFAAFCLYYFLAFDKELI